MNMFEAPNGKVGAGAFAGSVSVIVIWLANTFLLGEAAQIPAEMASAFTTVFAFFVSYIMPESA